MGQLKSIFDRTANWFGLLRTLDGCTCAVDWLVPALAGEVVADC